MTTEHAALTRRQVNQRTHVLGILDGLDEQALREPAVPSGWSCLDLCARSCCTSSPTPPATQGNSTSCANSATAGSGSSSTRPCLAPLSVL
jgi:hypothetical protein